MIGEDIMGILRLGGEDGIFPPVVDPVVVRRNKDCVRRFVGVSPVQISLCSFRPVAHAGAYQWVPTRRYEKLLATSKLYVV